MGILKNKEKKMVKKSSPIILNHYYKMIDKGKQSFSYVFEVPSEQDPTQNIIIKFSTKRTLDGMNKVKDTIDNLLYQNVNIPQIYAVEEYEDPTDDSKRYSMLYSKTPMPHNIEKVLISEEKIDGKSFTSYNSRELYVLLKALNELSSNEYTKMLYDIQAIHNSNLDIDTLGKKNVLFSNDKESSHFGIIFMDLSYKNDNLILESNTNYSNKTPFYNVLKDILMNPILGPMSIIPDYSPVKRYKKIFNNKTFNDFIVKCKTYIENILIGIKNFYPELKCEQTFKADITKFYNTYYSQFSEIFNTYNKLNNTNEDINDLLIEAFMDSSNSSNSNTDFEI